MATGAASAPAVPITAADQARIDQALQDARASNTRRQYRSAWKGWAEWAGFQGHRALPADPAAAAYLAESHRAWRRGFHPPAEQLAQPSAQLTVTRAQPIPPPMMASAAFCRASPVRPPDAGVARRRASPPTIAPPSWQPRPSHGVPDAGWRVRRPQPTGAPWTRRLSACCFRAGCADRKRRRCAGPTCRTRPTGVAYRSTSAARKPTRTVTAADVRYLKNGCAVALRQLRDRRTVQRSGLRPEPTDQVLGGLNGQSIARRLAAEARYAGIEGRITGHSGRVGLASELTARGASTTETMLAGGWKTARMVAHYSASATAEQGAVAKYL